ncbi:hypothetical protein AAG570_009774 [Ranatra chinensis]|uniref:Uncharacterized protein n=1 Tax=Ranatra chinensis TaxID=642074 RepID=A0ABD0YS67_9HEMI
MASKRRNMFHKNKTQETTEKGLSLTTEEENRVSYHEKRQSYALKKKQNVGIQQCHPRIERGMLLIPTLVLGALALNTKHGWTKNPSTTSKLPQFVIIHPLKQNGPQSWALTAFLMPPADIDRWIGVMPGRLKNCVFFVSSVEYPVVMPSQLACFESPVYQLNWS